MDNFFSTNAQHGSVCEFEDLSSVKMVNEKLETFMRNWETVLSGIQTTPDEAFLEPLFHRQIKHFKDLAHDINIYERVFKSNQRRPVSFCMSRKRLERNRERIAKQYGADGKPSAPAPKKKFVPKGFCFEFVQNGKKCKYKHEVPEKRGRSHSRGGGRGQPPSRATSTDGKPRECKFWKSGRCKKGSACTFLHTGKPGAPAVSGGSQGEDQEVRAVKGKMESLVRSRDPTRKALKGRRALRAARVRTSEKGRSRQRFLLLSAS